MPWQTLRLEVARLKAERAMRLEAEREHAEAVLVRELSRRRVTQRLSRWGSADRKVWAQHVEIRKSLKALRVDCDRKPRRDQSIVRHVGRALDCPACAAELRLPLVM